MTFLLFGGGLAGRLAAEALCKRHGGQMAAIVWDAATGEPPADLGIPLIDIADAASAADMALCSGFGHILPGALIDSFPSGAFNAHPSLLPSYRGRHAVQWAIASGETVLGVSLHEMTKQIDQGAVLLMRGRRFGLSESYLAISESLCEMAAQMLVEFVDATLSGVALPPIPIDPRADRYYPRRTEANNRIDWTQSSHEIINAVRATAPAYPATFRHPDGRRVAVNGVTVGRIPGQVLIATSSGCLVATGDGTVWIESDEMLARGDILT
ncbi:methionyl-tRNA formyltransferase [Bosea lathyri]|uniref:Formyl transferase, C-terminal domain n=1 Tax=Bosea lathyri TaxID=1036778 RepID=A0A1H6D636_9HYPH|nr:formyltransferase family protein [Bosea lathyri]SEG80243.1 Formyl transferase, C-terminal domain [Bosea lathyri]